MPPWGFASRPVSQRAKGNHLPPHEDEQPLAQKSEFSRSTGKQVTFTALGLSRFAEGKIVEHTFLGDMLGVLQQVGAVPSPGQSEEASPT